MVNQNDRESQLKEIKRPINNDRRSVRLSTTEEKKKNA